MYQTAVNERIVDLLASYGRSMAQLLMEFAGKRVDQAAIGYLRAKGTSFEVMNDDASSARLRIDPSGESAWNRRAAQLRDGYDGLSLVYSNFQTGRASFENGTHVLNFGPRELLLGDPKSPTLRHELRHVAAALHGARDFGGTRPYEDFPLPGSSDWYPYGQAYEEAETFSLTMRRSAEALLAQYLRPDINATDVDEATLAHRAAVAVIVAQHNDTLIEALERTLKSRRLRWQTALPPENHKHPDRYVLSVFLSDALDQPFLYDLTIHDQTIRDQDTLLAYLRAKVAEMSRLAPNYRTQFAVARQAAVKLTEMQTTREKAAVLAGLIAITRPHFWEGNRFVEVTEAGLIERFNAVASDRWQRYAYLDAK